MADEVKLDFHTDFTQFLEIQDYNAPVCVMTESETIQCNGLLLAQHSSVLREYLKEDKELFLTDNKHVRECLSILYGGSVELTEENFQDILKFMVCFDVRSARDQVLEWMSEDRWDLYNVGLLMNSSMTAVRSCVGVADMHSLREKVYKPCRLFLGKRLTKLINPNSHDALYKNIERARGSFLGRIMDRKEQLVMLLHQDLIPEYVHWIKFFVDQSVYHDFLKALDRPEILNKMSLCTRSQFEGLFDEIENFENITLKEYKKLNKYKLNIHEKMGISQSLRFMKENGTLYSWWRILDIDGISVVPIVCTETCDQFSIVENILSWIATRKPHFDEEVVMELLLKAFNNMSKNLTNNSLRNYSQAVAAFLDSRNISINFSVDPKSYCYTVSRLQNLDWFVCGERNVSPYDRFGNQCTSIKQITLSGYFDVSTAGSVRSGKRYVPGNVNCRFKVTVHLSPNAVPVVTSTPEDPRTSADVQFKFYVYAWKLSNLSEPRMNRGKMIRQPRDRDPGPVGYHYIPLYTDPPEAFNMVKQYQTVDGGRVVSSSGQLSSTCINFQILCV